QSGYCTRTPSSCTRYGRAWQLEKPTHAGGHLPWLPLTLCALVVVVVSLERAVCCVSCGDLPRVFRLAAGVELAAKEIFPAPFFFFPTYFVREKTPARNAHRAALTSGRRGAARPRIADPDCLQRCTRMSCS
ncbi:unnamed protein product, partial [Ectocarpus sp. 4 AP-2014]